MSLAAALARLAPALADFPPGHVWLAGAGPGHPGGLTLEVLGALAAAEAVVHDALIDPTVLRACAGAALHDVGKRAGRHSAKQSEINALLIDLARQGKRVLRLKGGDPTLFGRGGEEAAALSAAGIAWRFLPGVTSGLAALSRLGIPATLRGVNQALILATGHGVEAGPDWAALAATGQPLVIYMGMANLARIAEALIAGGLAAETPAAVIVSASLPGERFLAAPLGRLAGAARAAGLGAPGIIAIGEIVARREALRAAARAAASEAA